MPDSNPPPGFREPFPAAEMRCLVDRDSLSVRILDDPRLLFRILRALPILLLKGKQLCIVTRYDEVQEVLARDADFPVPFGEVFERMDRFAEESAALRATAGMSRPKLAQGTNFILGMANTPEYRRIHGQIMRAFDRADLPRIAAIARRSAEAQVAAHAAAGEDGRGRIDAIAELITRVPIEIVREYYGVPIADPEFALWTIGMSGYSFAPPWMRSKLEKAGLAGAERVGPVLHAAIRSAQAAPDPQTIVGRLVLAQQEHVCLTDDVIRASLSGMITGFVPTNTMAGGHILEMLLRRRDMLEAATRAAEAGDDDLLCRTLLEVHRFKPLNPGPFRTTAADVVLAEGTPRAKMIPQGTTVWAMTHSASFDPRRVKDPDRFDPARDAADTMMFGFGQHWCVGFALACVQLTQTFKPLLLAGNLRRAPGRSGRPSLFGVFPEHQTVTYGA